MKRVAWCCLAMTALGFTAGHAAEPISIESLLGEMIDRDAVARFPQSNFRLRQQSSYDRLSKTPDDPEGWFANKDHTNNFVRVETNHGRKEWVLMNHDGPGALVRSWMPDKRIASGGKTPVNATVRIYLDGADRPAIEGHVLDLFNGTGLIPPPFAHKSLASAVSFFPIPYAKSCKITLDEHPFHAQVRVGPFDKVKRKELPLERDTKGYSTETRTRALDSMPFGKSLQVDMEVWHWKQCDMSYAVGSYWYGFADTTTNRMPDEKEAAKPFIQPPADAPSPPRKPAAPVKRFDNGITLRAEVVASNSQSERPATFFGLDCVVLERARR